MDLYDKAAELGIQTAFFDGQGVRHLTDPTALKIILDAMPVRVSRRLLGGPVVIREGGIPSVTLDSQAAAPVSWRVMQDAATIAEGIAPGSTLDLPPGLPAGIYRLRLIDAAHMRDDAPVIVTPARAFPGQFDRSWILACQLYGVRSARNWGIGDFTDLEGLIDLAASLGAAGVGLNPLHALFDDRPGDCSPYSPNSRLFLNPLYIDVGRLPGVVADDDALQTMRSGPTVDYAAVARNKWQALRTAFAAFKAARDPQADADFDAYRAERGALLARFACFEALRADLRLPWWEWPNEWLNPDDAACQRLRAGPLGDAIAFVEYTQWIADRQLAACSARAASRGLGVGLYLDVAVGVQNDGFDAWNEQVAISRHLAVGAPPDPLNTTGQNWGLAGFNAAGLEMQSFAPFREMLRASMRYAGAIRLDHVLGLQRLYLVPHGFDAKNGVYVQMPFEALLAVTALESVANSCVVIGEDLGTVPDGFRDRLADWGVWSYRVMMFERDYHNGQFFAADQYPANALVTFNTHDLATFAGWRSLSDLAMKRSLGIDPGESDESRHHAFAMLSDLLHRNGISRSDFLGVLDFLALTPSRLMAVALEDLLGVVDQPNIPGTVNEHPNWRQRLPVALDDIAARIDLGALRDATRDRSAALST